MGYDYAFPASLFLDCLPFVSKDASRFYLQGVNVQPASSGGVNICATSGHILLLANAPNGFALENGSITIKTDKRLISACKAKIHQHQTMQNWFAVKGTDVSVILDGDIFSHRGLVQANFSDLLIDGSFPNYMRVFPKERFPRVFNSHTFALNPAYLGAFEHLGGKDGGIRLVAGDEDGGLYIVFHNQRQDVVGIIMPRREAPIEYPDWWLKQLKKEYV